MAVNDTGASPGDDAWRELGPVDAPSAHAPSVARPEAFDTAGLPLTEPLPPVTAKDTEIPLTPLPKASVISTPGAVGTGEPTMADCPFPDAICSEAAGPGCAVA